MEMNKYFFFRKGNKYYVRKGLSRNVVSSGVLKRSKGGTPTDPINVKQLLFIIYLFLGG